MLFLEYIETQLSRDLARNLRESSEKKRQVLEQQIKQKQERMQRNKEEREKAEHVTIEPNKLATFLQLFSSVGIMSDATPHAKFIATDYTFNGNAFSVQGYYDLTGDPEIKVGPVIRLYVLKLGIMQEDGLYHLGFVYPADREYSGLGEIMSLISGARIIR